MQTTQIKSHNQAPIDIETARSNANKPPVTFQANADELVELFGQPTFKGCDDPEWAVADDNGQTGIVRMINPFKAEVRSESNSLINAVLIAAELHRENKAARKKKHKLEEVLESASTIYESVSTVRGKNYAMAVEIAVCCRKFMEIVNATTGHLVAEGMMPEEIADKLHGSGATLMARIMGNATRMGGLEISNPEGAEELMNWAERVISTEETGIRRFLADELGKSGD